MSRGYFITFEGGEGAGKSTLMQRVAEELQKEKLPFIQTREPGGTALGNALREVILHRKEISLEMRSALLLFLADRAQHVTELIIPSLKKEKIVLCDRFTDSTFAYQGGKGCLPDEILNPLCQFAAHSLIPDLTFYLDIDPQIGLLRAASEKEQDRIEAQTLDFHQKIREAFLKLAKREKKRIVTIDATLSPKQVFEYAMGRINALLSSPR